MNPRNTDLAPFLDRAHLFLNPTFNTNGHISQIMSRVKTPGSPPLGIQAFSPGDHLLKRRLYSEFSDMITKEHNLVENDQEEAEKLLDMVDELYDSSNEDLPN